MLWPGQDSFRSVEMFTITITANQDRGVKSKLFFLVSLSSLGNYEDFSVHILGCILYISELHC